MSDLSKLVEKLRRIEALYSGAATPGEQNAADNAREKIKEKIEQCREADPPVEYKFTLPDTWSRMLLVALLRRYAIKTLPLPSSALCHGHGQNFQNIRG